MYYIIGKIWATPQSEDHLLYGGNAVANREPGTSNKTARPGRQAQGAPLPAVIALVCVVALIAGVILGVVAAFAQITGAFALTPANLTAALEIAFAALGILLVTASLDCRQTGRRCRCTALNALLAGILGTVALAALLLVVGITATSVLSALLVGIGVFFFTLLVGAAACYLRALAGCEEGCSYTED